MFRYGLIIAGVSFLLIQVSQLVLFGILNEEQNLVPLAPFFNLVYVWNPGISFGMLQDLPHGQWVLSGVALTIVIIMLFILRTTTQRFPALALGMIIGGAIGNIVDRLRFSAVFDYLDFHAFGYHYPAFNMSDSLIVLGVLFLFYGHIKECPHEKTRYSLSKNSLEKS